MPHGRLNGALAALAVPGMYLVSKYSEFKRQQEEATRRRVTEKELQHLNHKIVSDFSCCHGSKGDAVLTLLWSVCSVA